MAGGMNRSGRGVPLGERVRVAGAPADPPGDLGPDLAGGRHCWVLDPADGQGVKRAGLLLEWRRRSTHDGSDDGWEGRVVYGARLRADGWAGVEEWVPSRLLEPA